MTRPLILNDDRLFPVEAGVRAVARRLYGLVKDLPIISPHGHTDPRWFAYDQPFGNASAIPTYYCAKFARESGITRLLAGDFKPGDAVKVTASGTEIAFGH